MLRRPPQNLHLSTKIRVEWTRRNVLYSTSFLSFHCVNRPVIRDCFPYFWTLVMEKSWNHSWNHLVWFYDLMEDLHDGFLWIYSWILASLMSTNNKFMSRLSSGYSCQSQWPRWLGSSPLCCSTMVTYVSFGFTSFHYGLIGQEATVYHGTGVDTVS